MFRLFLAGLAGVLFASHANAQSLPLGARARVLRAGQWPLIGRVVDTSSAGLVLDSAGDGGSRVFLRYDQVQGLERSAGVHNHALIGGAAGFLAGAAFTAYFLAAFCGADSPCQGDEVVKAGTVFALPPALVGVVIGGLIRRERWVAIRPSRVTLRLGPGSVGVGLRF